MIPRKGSPKIIGWAVWVLASSLLLILSFPGPDIGWIACIALLPLLSTAVRFRPGRAFMLGWLCGAFWFTISLHWLTHTVRLYGGLPNIVSQLLILLLGCVLGLYTGIFASTVRLLSRRPGIGWYLVIPSAWVFLEYIRSWIPAPFPWLLLGSAFWRYRPVSGLFGIFGVYGMSFMIVLVNVLIWRTFEELPLRGGVKRGMGRAAVLILLAGLIFLAGSNDGVGDRDAALRIGIIQGNYEQDLKWDDSLEEEIVRTYLDLSDRAAAAGAKVILWPETSVQSYFQSDKELSNRLRAFSGQRGVHLVFGSPAFDVKDGDYLLYNRAYHLSPDGGVESYDKIRLVPFGEYVPFHPLLSFAERLVPGEGRFVPGGRVDPFALPVPAGPLICFEASMPDLSRDQVRRGARILLNITNDAWFGTTWGPYQHLAIAAVRAAENRTPLLRAANTGISAVIDSGGGIVQTIGLFQRGFIVADVVPGNSGTVYTRTGDWIVYASIIMIIFYGLRSWFLRRRRI